jgi:7-cyano-7-deazaguanine synthase
MEVTNSAIILLSGGLDSVVSLAYIHKTYKNILALTFDYGQKSFENEKKSAQKIANYYKIQHKIIKLDWLADISNSTLNTAENVPTLDVKDLNNQKVVQSSAKSVWVPNRNGLFINISACYTEALGYNKIVIGANNEEAQTFKDNSIEFINAVNKSLKNSTNSDIQVVAPLINMNKEEIVKEGIKLNVPFKLIYSCYNSAEKHCGHCESCIRLKRALEQNNQTDIIKELF